MNTETLALLEELAAQDPGSSIFLHVARLYRTHGDTARAVAVLRRGLANHPGHIEGGLLLADALAELGESDADIVDEVGQRLLRYPRFWQAFAQVCAQRGAHDLATIAGCLAAVAHTGAVDWGAVLRRGVEDLLAGLQTLPVGEPPEDVDAEEVTQFCLNASIRTKTMAKLFSMHGEHEQAVAIYEELLARAVSPEEREELRRLRDAELRAAGKDVSPGPREQVFSLLEKLAQRLETKSMARI